RQPITHISDPYMIRLVIFMWVDRLDKVDTIRKALIYKALSLVICPFGIVDTLICPVDNS
ncbi:hypothetical protein DKA88_24465, partial [Salmonella enterica subsp. enterica serovar Typhi]|nr:hypothetical protein [Salmonella enterica subsp. enterica serovar Typhi]